jgi:hypothetical protein
MTNKEELEPFRTTAVAVGVLFVAGMIGEFLRTQPAIIYIVQRRDRQ